MIPEDFPEFFPGSNPHFQKRKFLEDADVIVCVSEYTKSRLVAHYPTLAYKATVVYNGVELPDVQACKDHRKNQFLFVGDRGSYKDFNIVLTAFALVLKGHSDANLLCVGGKAFSESEKKFLISLGIDERVSQATITEEELQASYSESLATIVSSRVEGFGLPVVEAMANNCLVIATDIPVFKEIASDAYLDFPPGDKTKLAERMFQIIEDPLVFGDLKLRGIEIARSLSWSRMFHEISDIYIELASQ
jgi:glycosyltransferase involved in cell wall biosynthesis